MVVTRLARQDIVSNLKDITLFLEGVDLVL